MWASTHVGKKNSNLIYEIFERTHQIGDIERISHKDEKLKEIDINLHPLKEDQISIVECSWTCVYTLTASQSS